MATRFIMIGGFLGAGKTTTLGRLAQQFHQRGQRVGIVTNDQAADLVDTHLLRSQGWEVGEVAGACFCCHFNELLETAQRLEARQRPDVILAEPVGSCTDLVATVVRPLERLFGHRFRIAPYGVILKPSHGQKILGGQQSGFSPKAAYIFRKQLEEADFLLINRVDQLAPQEVETLADLLQTHYPGRPVLRISARTGQGFDELVQQLDRPGRYGRRVMDVDYDLYAEGEAELGWLNAGFTVTAAPDAVVDLDRLLLELVGHLSRSLAQIGAETAHVKAIGLWEGAYAVVNLTSRDASPELSLPSQASAPRAELVVNARVAVDPDTLRQHVHAAIEAAAATQQARAEFRQMQSFRPGRPVPTHRIVEPADA